MPKLHSFFLAAKEKLPTPIHRAASGIRGAWLSAVASRPVVRNVILPFFPALCLRIFLAFFQRPPFSLLSGSLGNELAVDFVLVIAGWGLVQISRTWGVRQMMGSVYDIAAATQEPKRAFLRNFAASEIATARTVVQELAQGTYRAENPEELATWFATLFADGGGWYKGVDSHLPSDFMQEYDWYLKTHGRAETVRNSESLGGDVRVLTSSRDDLTRDYARSTGVYGAFYEWHREHDVEARWLDMSKAEVLREKHGIGHADVGLWENYAVLFTPDPESEAVTFAMRFPGEDDPGGTSYKDISEFVAAVLDQSEDLGNVAPRLELIDQELAKRWERYVDPRSRDEGPLGNFLCEVLGGRQYVLDAAAGIGSDSVYLLERGYSVWSNEVDIRLAEAAGDYAASRSVPLHLTSVLWETLPRSLEGNMRFEAVLVLGNSLCLVSDEEQRRQCLAAFHDVLSPGGILVIDERNFEYMRNRGPEIERDPVRYFRPTLEGDVMYGGRSVRGFPAEISSNAIVWRFFDNGGSAKRDRQAIVRAQLNVKDLLLYPFRHGELFGLLKDAGFENIRVFGDLDEIVRRNGMPDQSAIGEAAFVTYVAERPRDDRDQGVVARPKAHVQGPGA
jgi:glycine/sarcosine N-methyltransferase